jgi:hypothetical protein
MIGVYAVLVYIVVGVICIFFSSTYWNGENIEALIWRIIASILWPFTLIAGAFTTPIALLSWGIIGMRNRYGTKK